LSFNYSLFQGWSGSFVADKSGGFAVGDSASGSWAVGDYTFVAY